MSKLKRVYWCDYSEKYDKQVCRNVINRKCIIDKSCKCNGRSFYLVPCKDAIVRNGSIGTSLSFNSIEGDSGLLIWIPAKKEKRK